MVAPYYPADLSVPKLDRSRNAKEREMGSSTMYSVLTIIIYYYIEDQKDQITPPMELYVFRPLMSLLPVQIYQKY